MFKFQNSVWNGLSWFVNNKCWYLTILLYISLVKVLIIGVLCSGVSKSDAIHLLQNSVLNNHGFI